MLLILLLLIFAVAVGGGGYGHSRYGYAGWSPAGIVLALMVILYFTGNLHVSF